MMGKETAVPMTVWLVPLTNFYSKAPQLLADSSTLILRKARNTLEAMRQLEMRCNDCLEDKTVKLFPQIRKKSNFGKFCNDYMLNLRQTIAEKLILFRNGEEDERSLLRVFEKTLRSPYNVHNLNEWMECVEREINVVRSCMDILEGAKPKMVSGQSEMFSELLDSSVKHALCFVFTFVTDQDPYLNALKEFLDSPKMINSKKLRPPAKQY